jgi:type I restriction enzyme, S subunit
MEDKYQLYELSGAWIWTTTSEVCSSVRDGTHDTPKYFEKGIPLITSKNLSAGTLDFSNTKYISLEDHIQISIRSSVENGDVLFAMIGTIGNPIVVETEREFSIKNIGLFKKNESAIISKYLKYWLSSFYFGKILENRALIKGTTQKFIPLGNLRIFPVPLAPLNEQRRIVAKIEALKERSQRVKDAIAQIPQLLSQFRQSVLAAAFRGDLTADWREQNPDVEPASVLLERIKEEFKSVYQSKKKSRNKENLCLLDKDFIKNTFENLPDNWQVTQIKIICSNSFYGPRFGTDEYIDDGIPSIRTTDMTDDGEIILQNPPRVNIPKNRLDDLKVLPGDLLVTRSGSIGMMAVFRDDYIAIPSAYLIRFRFSSLVNIDYIFYYFKSPIGQKLLGLNSTSVTQSNINAEAIKNIPIPIPPLEEQQQIVSSIKSLLRVVSRAKEQYQEIKNNLEQLDQSVLAKAFRGELVPQNPEDEPASQLCDRIRAEREKLQTKTAKKSPTKTSTKRTKKTLESPNEWQMKPQESTQLELDLE